MYSVLTASCVAAAIALVSTGSSGLIPFVLGFGAIVTVALGGAILVITWKDPSRLMLGQITGHEYAAIRRELTFGDDVSGERKTTVVEARGIVKLEDTTMRELPEVIDVGEET
jgi:hypothetical protein